MTHSMGEEQLATAELESIPTVLDICDDNWSQKTDVVEIDAPRKQIAWTKLELLGVGAFGHVYKGKMMPQGDQGERRGRVVAVKELRFSQATPAVQIRSVESEIRIGEELEHPNIVQQLDTSFDPKSNILYIFLEFVPFGSITSVVARGGPIGEVKARRYTRDILAGLWYMHERGIIHRDIKGANCLVANGDQVKLADFGTAAQAAKFKSKGFTKACDLQPVAPPPGFSPLPASAEHKALRGTSYYMAPEVIRGVGYGRRADVWSTGCTVVEMVTGHPPFHETKNQVAAMYRIASGSDPAPIPPQLSSEGKNFLTWCFKRDPNDRATVKYLRSHPWVSFSNIVASMQSPGAGATAKPSTTASSPGSNSPPPPPPRRDRDSIAVDNNLAMQTIMGPMPTFQPRSHRKNNYTRRRRN